MKTTIDTAIDTTLEAIIVRARTVEGWLLGARRATYGVAALRILVGVTGLGFLAANWSNRHYLWGDAAAWLDPMRSNGGFGWPFTLFASGGSPTLLTVKLLVVAALLVLMTLGWRTRIVIPLVLIMWVSLIEANPVYGDQSDNLSRILLVYLCFADASGRWSLDARRRRERGRANSAVGTLLHNLAVVAVAAQVCIIYVASGLYKVQGALWQDGTAVYYPLQVGQYRPWPELNDLVTSNSWGVLAATYFSVLIQIFFPVLLLRRSTRVFALVGTGAMHLSIAVLMGLPFFSLFIFAGDLVFIRDRSYARVTAFFRSRWTRRRRGGGTVAPTATPAPVKSTAGV
jgi:hypothetical protein